MSSKRLTLSILLAALLLSLAACTPKAAPAATPRPTPAPSATAAPAAPGWTAPNDAATWKTDGAYQLSAEGGELKAVVRKATPEAAFSATFPAMDLSARPLASVVARASAVARVSIGLTDARGHTAWMMGLAGSQEMAVGSYPMTHTFDFSAVQLVDLTQITGVAIAVDRGSPGSSVTVWLKDVRLGADAVDAPVLLPVPDQQVYPGAALRPVSLQPAWGRETGDLTWDVQVSGDAVKGGKVAAVDGGWQFTYTPTGETGLSPVRLVAQNGAGVKQTLRFTITVAESLPPSVHEALSHPGEPGEDGAAQPPADQPAASTGFADDFDGPSVDAALAGSGEGAHTLKIENHALRVDVDKAATGNAWAGLWYQIPGEVDLSKNPVVTLRMKASEPRPMCIFLWDRNDVYNTAKTVTVSVTGDWADYTFDFTGMNLDSDGRTVDFQHIKALLLNFVPGSMFTGTFWLDDLKVGDKTGAKAGPAPVKLSLTGVPQLALGSGSKSTWLLAGSGWNDKKARISVSGDYGKLLERPKATFAAGGVQLALSARAGAKGSGRLSVRVTQGSESCEVSMDVIVAAQDEAADIIVDGATTYQTMDGFGAFLGSGVWDKTKQDIVLPWVKQAGITIGRFGVIDQELEPVNDNSDPTVTDYTKFNPDALPLAWMKRLKEEGGVQKFIVTLWSPPHWMKYNKSLAAATGSADNYLEPRYYEEFAEQVSALCAIVRESTGIDLYAVSLQNEPQFNEPYASALLDADHMAELIAIVGKRLKDDGFSTKILMPEAVVEQGGIDEYIQALDRNPDAAQYVDTVAIHNYDKDGIHVGGAGAQEWQDIYGWANAAAPRKLWMSETSGHPNSWQGAVTLFGNIHNALNYGNVSGWLWWTLADTEASAEYGLVVDNKPTARYAVSAAFYRAIAPGAVRLKATPPEGLIATTFRNPDGSTATVLYNDGSTRWVGMAGAPGALASARVIQQGQLDAPVETHGNRVLVPAGAVSVLIYR